ncbi:MAG TPA: S41 family peptidase [Mycobacteriales bacterium]|jgi:hypothetical protein|nr:S41 family peptidase [Mycobacteriales bacterium]
MQPTEIDELVTRAGDLVVEHYVFEDVAKRVREVLAAARYADGDPAALAEAVTRDLQSVNGDLHLRLRHYDEPIPEVWDDAADAAARHAKAVRSMGGVAKIELLEGNVALLALAPSLFPIGSAGPAVTAALQLVASADALLLDLRGNRGGDPRTVALVCGYLLDEHTHLVTMHQRDTGETFQSWSVPWVPGPRFGGTKPLAVLVGPDTFSGAEELAYDLQQLRPHTTVVGERTRGGAHPCEGYRLHPHLELTVPTARALGATTGANWEGVGITPDVETGDPFPAAYQLALAAVQ